jgi:hypothetical protein
MNLEDMINSALTNGQDLATLGAEVKQPATEPVVAGGAFDFLVDAPVAAEPAPVQVQQQAAVQSAPAQPEFDYASAIAAEQARAAQAAEQAAYYRGQAEMLAAARTQAAPAPAAAPDRSMELTTDEIASYSEGIPVIQKLAFAEAQRALKAAGMGDIQSQTAELNKQLAAQTAALAEQKRSMQEFQLTQQLTQAVPDLADFTKTPAWQEYIKQPDPLEGGRMTRGEVIRAHWDSGNVKAIAAHINMVRTTQQPAAPAAASKKIAAPIGSGGQPIPPGSMGASQQISMSRVTGPSGLTAMRSAGKLTPEGYAAALEALYNNAASGVALTA